MNVSRLGVCVWVAALALLPGAEQEAYARCQAHDAPNPQGGFCLSAPRPRLPSFLRQVRPSDNAPFAHWDLREFENCVVPYSFFDGTTDVAGFDEFDATVQAFMTWEAVSPALIAFRRVDRPAGAMCPFRMDGHNIISWDDGPNCRGAIGDDVCALADGDCTLGRMVGVNTVIVRPGADGFLTTLPRRFATPANPDGDEVFILADGTPVIRSGPDGDIDTVVNDPLPPSVTALNAIFSDAVSGRILEADILFNDKDRNWRVLQDGDDVPLGNVREVRTDALHEIGHFIGLHHVPMNLGVAPVIPPEIMRIDPELRVIGGMIRKIAQHGLAMGDTEGADFLYTPDLGDAPDPLAGMFNRYPSKVHTDMERRRLNDVRLFLQAQGAEHLFGIFGASATPRYQYEWLGTSTGRIDDNSLECEARVPDRDRFDDGVNIGLGRRFVPGGGPIPVTVTVRTALDAEGRGHIYNDQNRLFVNAWFDWDANGSWDDPGEHVIGALAGAFPVPVPAPNPPFLVRIPFNNIAAPAGAKRGGFARFRLDYREDVGQIAAIDPTLMLNKGAAQFGEVEDYPIPFAPPDQLHTIGPVPNRIPVGGTGTIMATVQARFKGFAGEKVVFTRQLGSFAFTSGMVSADGRQTKLETGSDGSVTVTFTTSDLGRGLVRVAVSGTSLTAYSFFVIVP